MLFLKGFLMQIQVIIKNFGNSLNGYFFIYLASIFSGFIGKFIFYRREHTLKYAIK